MINENTSMYYRYNDIDGYHCPVKIIVSRRGLGKTFTPIRRLTERFLTKGRRFIYVVETGEMVKELCRNNGEKFWKALLEYYKEQDTSRKRYFFNKLSALEIVDDGDEQSTVQKLSPKIQGGTILINKDTAGYIVDMNSFAEIKRNNFNGVKSVFIDEFISEKLDKTSLENPRKISSIIQSVARTRDIEIIMCGNSVRLDDPILARLGFHITKYGWYRRYDKYGLFAVLHFVDPAEYPKFAEVADKSVAGRFASMLGETAEEENKFVTNIPADRKLRKFDFKKGGTRWNLVKDTITVSLVEMKDGSYACVPFSAGRAQNLFCMTPKEQGFFMGYHVICNEALRPMLLGMLRADIIYYYSEVEYAQLKLILKGAK